MRTSFLILVLFFTRFSGIAQSLRKPVSAPCIGLGAYSREYTDAFSVTANQASLATLENIELGIFGEQRFSVQGLNMYSMIFALPSRQGNFAFQADYFGYKNFNESQLGLAYARSLGPKVDVGIKFNYYSFRIPAYQTLSAVNFEIGFIAHLTQNLHTGLHVYNPVGGSFSKIPGERLGSVYTFGVGYEAGESFMISTEIVKPEDLPVNVNVGAQYRFAGSFFARLGISTQNDMPFAGAGIKWNNLRLDLTASFHSRLGISPGMMLLVNFKKRGNEE